ncbi:MAG: cell division protein FtsH [Bacteroidetes bacterium]|nr:cell division protein FtsH [Bacteroidota bacterium]
MSDTDLKVLANVFEHEARWLAEIINQRTCIFRHDEKRPPLDNIAAPVHEAANVEYTNLISRYNLSFEERLLLALTFIPHLKPEFLLEKFRNYNMGGSVRNNFAKEFPEIGLIAGQRFAGTVPTGLTFLFLASEPGMENRIRSIAQLRPSATLFREKVVFLDEALPGDPVHSGRLVLSNAYFDLFTK